MIIAIGIDVHKELCVGYAVFAGQGEPRPAHTAYLEKFNKDFRRFPSNSGGMKSLAERVDGHEVHILIENSTKAHDVYWMLTNLGLDVTVAHAPDLYNITMSTAKNDDNDARKLAGYMRRRLMGENEFHVSHIPSLEVLRNRELCRLSVGYTQRLSDLKKQIRSHLLIRGIELSVKYRDITCGKALKEILALNDPVLAFDVSEARDLKCRITEITKLLRHLMEDDPIFKCVWSITGFGVFSASFVACMIDDITRFEDPRSFSASVGLTPRLYESADKPSNCGISRRGDPDLRHVICQATFVHIFHADSHISEKYKRLKANGKSHNEALTACANSMGRMIWKLVDENRCYDADEKELSKARAEADSSELLDKMDRAERDGHL